MLLLLFMHSNQYFLRSVKSNMNDNLLALAENDSSTQTHLQAQSADEIPVSSASILPTTTSQVFSTPLSSSTSVHQSLLQNTQPPTIIIQNSPQLQFDPSHIDMFFHTFDAHYFGKHLTEEQLYFELIKCLSSEHFHKASLCMSRDSVNSYTTLKAALIKAYSLPLHKRLTQLCKAPPLGDRSPTQLLYDLKNILGTIDPQDETLNWFLQTEFINKLPNNIQFILAAFPFKSVEELAPIADSLIQNDKSLNSSEVNSTDDVFSAMLKEFSSLKAEVLALHKILSHQTTIPHFTYPSHNRSHSKSFNENPQNHFPTSSQQLPFSSTLQPPPGPNLTIPGRDKIFNGLCFYHQKYGTTARYCVQGYTHFDSYMKTKHLNSQGNAPQ